MASLGLSPMLPTQTTNCNMPPMLSWTMQNLKQVLEEIWQCPCCFSEETMATSMVQTSTTDKAKTKVQPATENGETNKRQQNLCKTRESILEKPTDSRTETLANLPVKSSKENHYERFPRLSQQTGSIYPEPEVAKKATQKILL